MQLTIIVLDSVGAGALPDAAAFGDAGAHTLNHTLKQAPVPLPHLARLGLGKLPTIDPSPETVPADAERTWATLTDLEGVAGCFPGATITSAEGDHFEGTVKVKLGPIALVYLGSGSIVEKDATAHRMLVEAKGKDKRGNGTAGATVTMQLAPSGEGTRVDVTTELAITGKPAQFGRGVMQDVSNKLLQQFISCIEGQFADVAPPPQPPAAAAPAEPTPDAAPAEPPRTDAAPAESPVAPAVRPALVRTRRPPSPTASSSRPGHQKRRRGP